MRYKLVIIPFMGHYHCTLTHIPVPYDTPQPTQFWDVGPDEVHHPEAIGEVLSYIAGEMCASTG